MELTGGEIVLKQLVMAISDLQTDALGKDSVFGNDFLRGDAIYTPDFTAIAKSFGITAYSENTPDGIKKVLAEAVRLKKPAFINADVCRDYPNSGGRSFGWWDVPIPAYMKEKRENYENQIKEETL